MSSGAPQAPLLPSQSPTKLSPSVLLPKPLALPGSSGGIWWMMGVINASPLGFRCAARAEGAVQLVQRSRFHFVQRLTPLSGDKWGSPGQLAQMQTSSTPHCWANVHLCKDSPSSPLAHTISLLVNVLHRWSWEELQILKVIFHLC